MTWQLWKSSLKTLHLDWHGQVLVTQNILFLQNLSYYLLEDILGQIHFSLIALGSPSFPQK